MMISVPDNDSLSLLHCWMVQWLSAIQPFSN